MCPSGCWWGLLIANY
uniref:Uncharacterized protein n=1 Tax=Rhizophora mucronata TaxID=61149 RepID=A0A2P2PRG6_RHIMU